MFSLTVVIAALLAASVSAQSLTGLPTCAQNCTLNAIPSSCNLNPKCICSDAGFINAITCCVSKVCDQADQEATIKYADSICVPAGVTNLPTAAICKANSTSTATGLSTATGSAAMSISSMMSSTVMSSAMSASTSVSSGSVGSSSATSGAAVASSTGDASRAFYAQGLGMMGAAIGAAVALM